MTKSRAKGIFPPDTRAAILENAIPLFACAGFDGVAMREIAKASKVTAPALYYHFPNKEGLYLEAMALAFADKAQGISAALSAPGAALDRLHRFVEGFTRLMADDPHFRALLHRELLDGDATRLRLLSEQVFEAPFRAVADLAAELAPGCDPHLLAISIAGLILFHFETAPLRRYLPGRKREHDEPQVVARHIMSLLAHGLAHGAEADSRSRPRPPRRR